mmetsp:Transcript_20417/g.48317  ORF Transcript_20417/g.48317 Transcript_20417/m.48317 type:complete len:164 (+) Transcript_20417:103-594(+)
MCETVKYTNCASGQTDMLLKTVEANPWPPVKGKAVNFDIGGILEVEVTKGTYSAELITSYQGIKIFDSKVDLCSFVAPNTGFSCPQSPGNVQIQKAITLPAGVPSGQYDVTLKAYETSTPANEVFCVAVSLDIGGSEEKEFTAEKVNLMLKSLRSAAKSALSA